MSVRVLIVDDDRDHAESLADVLEMQGHRVDIAETGEAAVARFGEAAFDLVLMDVRLPGMNGVETFFALRRLAPDLRVLMMTGFRVEQLVAPALAQGALGVLQKPFAIADLLRQVEPATDPAPAGGLVLVADDDEAFAESVAPILAAQGYRVAVARSGEEAIARATAEAVDCLILDIRMPGLSGLDVYLRLQAAGRAPPTILVTGYATDEAARRLAALAQACLVKPIEPRALIAAVAGLTGHAA